MHISKEQLEEFKRIYKKEYGDELTDDEAYDAAYRVAGFAKLAFDFYVEDKIRKQKLKKDPKGFSLEGVGVYTCPICGRSTPANEMWYDKYGQKCIICQKAIDKRIIPGNICKNEDLWYSTWEFDSYFKMKTPTVNKLVRQNILRARIIPDINCSIFLIKDNIDILPPKTLLESRSVQVAENTYSSQRWYKFQDPKEVLKDYKILEYINISKLLSDN